MTCDTTREVICVDFDGLGKERLRSLKYYYKIFINLGWKNIQICAVHRDDSNSLQFMYYYNKSTFGGKLLQYRTTIPFLGMRDELNSRIIYVVSDVYLQIKSCCQNLH